MTQCDEFEEDPVQIQAARRKFDGKHINWYRQLY